MNYGILVAVNIVERINMTLKFFVGNATEPTSRVYVDYDYQAEIHVSDTAVRYPTLSRWELSDHIGLTCVWEREIGSTAIPDISRRSARFTGKWKKGPNEVEIPEPDPAGN